MVIKKDWVMLKEKEKEIVMDLKMVKGLCLATVMVKQKGMSSVMVKLMVMY